jgi:hypothetical protein
MNDQPVPLLAYGLISITTLVLAYATFLDKEKPNSGNSVGQSSTSMLPNISAMSPFSTTPSTSSSITSSISSLNPLSSTPTATALPTTPMANVLPSAPSLPSAPTKVGGKAKKKTKRNYPDKKQKKTRSQK